MTKELQAAVELESAFETVVDYVQEYPLLGEAHDTIRAHIAAQSSEIEALKHDLSSYIEASSELATDNERLRDAIIQYVICCPADRDTTNDFLKASYKLDEALAEGAKNDNI